jgi:uncharacterized integral membrane protein
MRVFVWLFRAFIFFALFAFALNNSQEAEVRWFFGHEWRAPMVIIVLLAFGCGAALGVLAMVPAWWKHRRVAQRQQLQPQQAAEGAPAPAAEAPNASVVRDGL